MMHPLTAVTFAAFLGAGFYVFQTKEEVAKLDRELRDIRRQTEQEAGRTQILGAEWARLNDQERLRQMAANHLRHMQPMEPAQFQRLEDAQRRMPAAGPFQAARTGFEPRTDIASAPGGLLVVTLADIRPAAPAPVQLARAPAPAAAPPAPAAVPATASAPAQPAAAAVAPAAPPSAVAPPVVLAASRPATAPAPRPAARPAPRRTELAALPPVATPAHQPRPPQPPISNLPASPSSAIPQPPIRTAMATAPIASAGSLLGGASLPPPVPFR